MLLRNMNIKLGLCNGSRFVLLDCSNPFLLKCQLIPPTQLAPDQQPTIFYLPRINMTPTEQYPFRFQRKQFPILPAFAMTINKSQGGTFDKVGIDLSTPVFSHGQLYVALSRVRSFSSLKILLPQSSTSTHNHVYTQILDNTHRDVPSVPRPAQHNPDGHYYHEDDPQNDESDDVIDAVDVPHIDDSDNDNVNDNLSESDDDIPVQQQAPLPPPPTPAPIVRIHLDPWSVIDHMPLDERMALHNSVITHLNAQQPQSPPPSSPPPTPRRPPPTPTRRQPPREKRNMNY
jgi:hypothetical protein